MRIVNVLRNSIFSLSSFAVLAIATLLVRKFFVVYLPVDLLGIEGVFSSIVQMLSLAEMGLTSIISYSLYRELAKNNKEEINILMSIYRHIYMIIGSVVLIISVVLFFFLPYVIKETSIDWEYIQFAYAIQIGLIMTTYFLAYKRTLYVADQKEYICIKIDTVCKLFNNVAQVLALVMFQSYFLYAVSGLLFNILANVIISHKVQKSYPFLQSIKVSIQEIQERRFFKDIGNLLIHKIAGFVWGGTDPLFASSFLGLHVTGLLANYNILSNGIFSVMYKVLQGIVPSVGNLVNDASNEEIWRIYNILDFGYLIFGGYIFAVYAALFQPFVSFFFGEQFLLHDSTMYVWGLYVFIMIQFENACNFRSSQGNFENDRKYMIMAAVTKMFLAIPAMMWFGLTGLIAVDLLGWCWIGYGRVQFVFRLIFNMNGRSILMYLSRHLWFSVLVTAEVLTIKYILDAYMPIKDGFDFISYAVVGFMLMTVSSYVLFFRVKEFDGFCEYVFKVFYIIREKSISLYRRIE